MSNIKTILADLYLDWVNNFLSIHGFASYHYITEQEAQILIDLGRKYHEERVSNVR